MDFFKHNISVIVPIAAQEQSWRLLIADLKNLPHSTEIIFVSSQEPCGSDHHLWNGFISGRSARWIICEKGRAKQLNEGARVSTKQFLWFLHADSRIKQKAFNSLERSVFTRPHALHYFNLRFQSDGPWMMKLNTLGVWIRSHILKLPFGDQGLCVSRNIFESLDGFPEELGEDHLFVWKIRQKSVPLVCVGHYLYTSARKYCEQGWWKTTLQHGMLTLKQAFPQWLKR